MQPSARSGRKTVSAADGGTTNDGPAQAAPPKPTRSEEPMTDEPDIPKRPQIYESDQEVIEQAIRLLAELDDAR